MNMDFEIPNTPEEAVQMVHQEMLDDAFKGLEKLIRDLDEIKANIRIPINPIYVIDLLGLTIKLSEIHIATFNQENLRPDQIDRIYVLRNKRQ